MKTVCRALFVFFVFLALVFQGVGVQFVSARSLPVPALQGVIPSLASLDPVSAPLGGPDLLVTLGGSGFQADAIVHLGVTDTLTSSFVSETSLTATIPAAALATAGLLQLSVENPGVGTSSQLDFTVTNPAAVLSALDPASAVAGAADMDITLTGSGFVDGAQVFLGAAQLLSSTVTSASQMTATLPASALVQAAVLNISVSNPYADPSNALDFTVHHPAPELTSLAPDFATAGDGDVSLLLTGQNFSASSSVLWNGVVLDSSYLGATQLRAIVPASFIYSVSKANLAVTNADGSSGLLPFQIYPRTDTWLTQSPEGGDIYSLSMDPSNPDVLYAGSRNAGMFKSIDGGERWFSSTNGIQRTEIWTVKVYPTKPAVVFAGDRDAFYRSDDGGAFWKKIFTTGAGGFDVIKFHPQNANLVFIATYANLYRSGDGGLTWTDISGSKLGGAPGTGEICQFSLDALDPKVIYITKSMNPGMQYWKSIDAGVSWALMTGITQPQSIYADPQSAGVVYAAAGSGIYKSINKGQSWTKISDLVTWRLFFSDKTAGLIYALVSNQLYISSNAGDTWALVNADNGAYWTTLAFHPTEPDTFYVGSYKGVSKSVDGGASWAVKIKGLSALEAFGMAYATPTHSLYVATGMGGMWKSSDMGQNWAKIIDGAANSVTLDPNNPDHLFVQELETTDGGLTWASKAGYRGMVFAANSDLYGGVLNDSNAKINLLKSTDDAVTWVSKTNGLPGCGTTVCWVNFIVTDPSNPQLLYAGLGQQPASGTYFGMLYKSTNGAESWSQVVNGSTAVGGMQFYRSLTIDPSNSKILYLVYGFGIKKSIDGGLTWTETGPMYISPNMRVGDINVVAVDPANGKILYAGTGGWGVYRSLDGGVTWDKFNYGLPNSIVNYIVAIPPVPAGSPDVEPSSLLVDSAGAQLRPRLYATAGGLVYGYVSVNYAPTGLNISSTSVAGRMPLGSLVGNLSTVDKNSADVFRYALVAGTGGTDNARFRVSGSKLVTAEVFDQAVRSKYSIRLRSTDLGGYTFERVVTINIAANSKVPLLLTPLQSEKLLYNLPKFDWMDVTGASSYTLQIGNDSAFTSLLMTMNPSVSTALPAAMLPVGKQLYWRVRSNSAGGASAWSITRTIITAKPPSRPVPVLPASGWLSMTYLPKLDWGTVTVPAGRIFGRYQVQVATDSAFTAVVVDKNINGLTSSALTLSTPLSPNRRYFWRVRAFNSLGEYSQWSPTWNFRTVMLAPVLIAPAPGVVVTSLRPSLDWADVSGAAGYKLQISRDSAFTQLIGTFTISGPVSTYTPALALPANTLLYWRVLASGPNGPSPYCGARSFRTPA